MDGLKADTSIDGKQVVSWVGPGNKIEQGVLDIDKNDKVTLYDSDGNALKAQKELDFTVCESDKNKSYTDSKNPKETVPVCYYVK